MKTIRRTKGMQTSRATLFSFAVVMLVITLAGCNQKQADVEEEEETQDIASVKENNSKVNEFVTFVQNDENKMDLDHEYTNEALNKMTEAISAMANEIDYNVQADLDKVKQYADQITKDPFATTHADNIRKSADVLTGTLQKMQQQKYPEMENDIKELKEACAAIKPEVLTLEQKSAVKSFFSKGADVLEKMN